MNQNLGALLHLGDDEQGLPGREPVLRDGGSLFPRDVVGLASTHAGGDGDVFGVGTAGRETESAGQGMDSVEGGC